MLTRCSVYNTVNRTYLSQQRYAVHEGSDDSALYNMADSTLDAWPPFVRTIYTTAWFSCLT